MTESEPQYAIGVLCYNGIRFLDDCFKSLLDQDFPLGCYEVLMMDNGSTDGSADYVEQHFDKVRVIRLGRNYGCTGAANEVLNHTKARYVGVLNQDSVVHRHWLHELAQAMASDPKVKMVHSNTVFPWWPDYLPQEREKLIDRAYVCDLSRYGINEYRMVPVTASSKPIPTLTAHAAASLVDRSIVNEMGYLADAEFFCYADDVDVALRVNALGYKVAFAPKAICYHNTAWHIKFNWHTVRKSMWTTRNTFVAFYKVCSWPEFLVLLPLLFVGNIQKARQHVMSPLGKLVVTFAAIPQTTVGLIEALWMMPSYRSKRQMVLSRRVGDRWWLLREMFARNWSADKALWMDPDHSKLKGTVASGAAE